MFPAVTVAVVSWNTRDLLGRCLDSLLPDVERGLAEVVVIDNGSTDGSPDLVRERHGWATLIEPGENLGFGRAVNLVARQSSAAWIAPSNADIALEPGALDALLDAGELDPRAGAVAPRLILPDGSTQHSVFAFPTLPTTTVFALGAHRLSRHLGDHLMFEGFWDSERPRAVDWAVGAFLLVRRTAWDEAGGFDDGQWMYAEDLDLGWRLDRDGWHTRYVPSACVRHERGAAASQAFGGQSTEKWVEATYDWMGRRRGTLRTRMYAAVQYAAARLRVILLRLSRRPQHRALRAEYAGWANLHRRHLRGRGRSDQPSNSP